MVLIVPVSIATVTIKADAISITISTVVSGDIVVPICRGARRAPGGVARNIIITSIIVGTVNGCGCFYLLLWIHYATLCDYSKIYNL